MIRVGSIGRKRVGKCPRGLQTGTSASQAYISLEPETDASPQTQKLGATSAVILIAFPCQANSTFCSMFHFLSAH